MNKLNATSIIDNKFWVIENEKGERIGTVAKKFDQIHYTVDDKTEVFPSIQEMITRKGISVSRKMRKVNHTVNEVYGFPTDEAPYNELWNVQNKLPMFTKNEKSSSYFCAGYYLVKIDKDWEPVLSPKLITIQRYEFRGPFKTKNEQEAQLRKLNETA